MEPRLSGRQSSPDALTEAAIREALVELLRGSLYADRTGGDRWEFAVEIHELRRLGLTDNDLRLLVRLRYVEHASETTSRCSNNRTFRPTGKSCFTSRTCFVLTALGAAKASHDACGTPIPGAAQLVSLPIPRASVDGPCLPCWDGARRLLTYNGRTVKQFKRRAINQELVLATFQEENWPVRIFDPMAPRPCQDVKRRLGDTVWCLNHGQVEPLLHFRADGTGEAILWEPAG